MRAVFVDSLYWVAVVNPNDQWHEPALAARARLGDVKLVTTQDMLGEFLTGLSRGGKTIRDIATQTVRQIAADPSIDVVHSSWQRFELGVQLYGQRLDKAYSVQDCVAMNVMRERDITEVLTHDRHFEQEGFNILIH